MSIERRKLLFIAACLVADISSLSAQASTLKVSLADTVRSAAPGSAVAYFFTIESPGGKAGSAEFILPPGWRALSGGGTLPEGSPRILYMVSAGVPATAAPGRYRVELAVKQ